MIGLSIPNNNASINSILYGLSLLGGVYRVSESGNQKFADAYTVGDVFRV